MTVYQKSLLATFLVALAVTQLVFISVSRGWMGNASGRTRRYAITLHRFGGYTAFVIILYVAYYCVFEVSPVGNPYKSIHAVLGALTVLLIASKSSIARVFSGLRRRLPVLGGTLLITIIGAWLTSAAWYLVNY